MLIQNKKVVETDFDGEKEYHKILAKTNEHIVVFFHISHKLEYFEPSLNNPHIKYQSELNKSQKAPQLSPNG
jgi:hypothetical protein